jgi:hypothetical protein
MELQPRIAAGEFIDAGDQASRKMQSQSSLVRAIPEKESRGCVVI